MKGSSGPESDTKIPLVDSVVGGTGSPSVNQSEPITVVNLEDRKFKS